VTIFMECREQRDEINKLRIRFCDKLTHFLTTQFQVRRQGQVRANLLVFLLLRRPGYLFDGITVQIRKRDVDNQSVDVGPVYRTDLSMSMEATQLFLARYAPFIQWIENTAEASEKPLAPLLENYQQSMRNLYRTEIRRFFTHTKFFIAQEQLGSTCTYLRH